jgi:hypothetical protein
VAVDNSGNVFVTGPAAGDTFNDYVTIKYSSAGAALWTNRYDGPGNNNDYPNAMTVDGNGDVFVTGMTSEPGWRYATIKYSSAGVALWTNLYSGPWTNDYANALALDSRGNVFVTGESGTGAGSSRYATIKYSGSGMPLWTNFFNGPTSRADGAQAIAVDRDGSAFVTGVSIASIGRYDWMTIKLSSTGALLWTRPYYGLGNDTGSPHAIAMDANGNVFVTGESPSSPSARDWATIGYSNSGVPLWTNRYRSPGSNEGQPALAVDGNGNVFVAGPSQGTDGLLGYGYGTIGYSSSGVPLWTNRYEIENSSGARAVAVDSSGNVFVSGGTASDIPTIAYSGAGVPLWTNRHPGQGTAHAIAVDNTGNVIVAGQSAGSFITIKYSGQAPIPSPSLSINQFDHTVVLSWTNAAFGLQSAPVATGNFTNLSGAISPFTNPISGAQRYFRLKAN